MKTLLICHDGADLDQLGLARWFHSFSDLVGVVVIREPSGRMKKRIRREVRRVGATRFVDVLAFRIYHRLFLAAQERAWQTNTLRQLASRFPELPRDIPILHTQSPNSIAAERFIMQQSPDVMLARCKTLLKESVFTTPRLGTFVLHPGICPEYRNAHGCFWALANGDVERVGVTLLRIDRGVDTGPVFGYFSYAFDEVQETPFMIQDRTVIENLDAIRDQLLAIERGEAEPVDTSGRTSAEWGQPWLSRYLRWKHRARARAR